MDLLYRYSKHLSNYAESTKQVYYSNVLLYLKYLETKGKVNPITICNVGKGDIYNYIAYMDHLSKNTKKIRLYSIKDFYTFIDKGIAEYLFDDIKLFKTEQRLPSYLTWSQTKNLIEYYKDKRNRLIIYLLLTTGIRVNECATIRLENISLEERIIQCRCKGNKTRNVYINEQCAKMIREYIQKETEGSLFKITKADIQYVVKKALTDLNIKGSTHTLRHTAATIIYQNTKDILLVKEFLGHKSVISSQIYAHINNDFIRRAVEKHPLADYGEPE